MKHTLLLLAVGVTIGAVIANQNKKPEVTPDPVELIIEKSKQTMKQAAAVSQRADQKVLEQVQEMKQTIEVLVEEKEQLVEQVKVMENEIVAVKTVAPAQPFDVLAIGVPDTASRK
jgi:hypothetical protein